MIKCDVCEKREAVYYRTYSGHRLCRTCLERILARSVKRAISSAKILNPRSRILAIIRPSEPMQSLAALRLLSIVEAKFDAEIHALLPQQFEDNESVRKIIDKSSRKIKINLIIKKFPLPKTFGIIHCLRYERAWALSYTVNKRFDAIAYPITRTCLNLVGLEALLTGSSEALSEALPYIKWTSPPIFTPLANIEGEAITAYAYLEGISIEPICYNPIPAKIPLLSILGRRPELEFSSSKTIMKLASKYGTSNYCIICGGYTVEGRICRYCIESGASEFFSRE